MPRRSHKKSRQGCRECKRRHLKCDENRPRCINCVTAQLKCPYESERDPVGQQSSSVDRARLIGTPSSMNSDVSKSPASSLSIPTSAPNGNQSVSESPLNMLHLELLYSWTSDLYLTFIVSEEGPRAYADICIKHGLENPFLMRQMLATSALHFSIIRPDRREYYHRHAVQLQSEALTGFNAALGNLDKRNIIPAFLVSSLIGMHSFCDTFFFRDDDFNATLDSLVSCINLLRGVKSLIGGWWPFLLSSELNPILEIAREKRERKNQHKPHLQELRKLIEIADIGPASKNAYEETIVELEQLYASQSDSEALDSSQSSNMIFAWLVTVPKDYVELLIQRRPEALIILAHYAISLHRRRLFWAVGDSGHFLISGINLHLGRHWEQWLTWPISVITTDDDVAMGSN